MPSQGTHENLMGTYKGRFHHLTFGHFAHTTNSYLTSLLRYWNSDFLCYARSDMTVMSVYSMNAMVLELDNLAQASQRNSIHNALLVLIGYQTTKALCTAAPFLIPSRPHPPGERESDNFSPKIWHSTGRTFSQENLFRSLSVQRYMYFRSEKFYTVSHDQ